MPARDLTRRRFIRDGLMLGTSSLFASGCSRARWVPLAGDSAVAATRVGDGQQAVVLGLYARRGSGDPRAAVRDVCKALDWSWLSRGDSVFVKLSSNSHAPHPSTTSPNAVRAVVAELLERGAGRVLVGDQGGVDYIRKTKEGRRHRSTRELTQCNGLYNAIVESGATPLFFDDLDFENGYFRAESPSPDWHWREPPYLPNVIREVDHIVYLPRLSSHILSSYTHGHKIAVGWLREDSRFQMHFEAGSYHEKYVEVNYFPDVRNRLRMVITLAEQMLLQVGPRAGTIGDADSWVVVGSTHLAHHEVVSVAVLNYIHALTPWRIHVVPPPYGPMCNSMNWAFVDWYVRARSGIAWGKPDPWKYQALHRHDYQQGIRHDLALMRAYEILGGVPESIPVVLRGRVPAADFRAHLEAHSGGVLRLQA